jgi:hypothetical protein
MRYYSPPSLKGNLTPIFEVNAKKGSDGWVVTSMEETWGSWIVGIPHVPTWPHLQSDHSIGSCRIG